MAGQEENPLQPSGTKRKYKWKDQRQAFKDALKYVHGRRTGQIKSFQTPWSKMNDAGIDGLEWHSMVVIGGRPGSGKTTIKSQIVRQAHELNPGENIRVLEFQFEMVAQVQALREFSSVTGLSYKNICSASKDQFGKRIILSQEQVNKCYEYAQKRVEAPIDIVENPCDTNEIKSIIRSYMEAHATKQTVKVKNKDGVETTKVVKVYPKTVITLDHSYLVRKAKGESNKTDMLYNLGEACTELKREYPIIFIILSQLKREVDKPERTEDGKYGNYILESDILGGDALTQHADMVIGVNCPAKKFIKFYGPDRFIIDDETVLVWHFLKCRNGDVRISFMKAEYHRMCVTEMDTPGRQTKTVSTKNV